MAIYDEYISRNEFAESTEANYVYHISKFAKFCGIGGVGDIDCLQDEKYEAFIESLKETRKATTINNFIRSIDAYLRWMYRKKLTDNKAIYRINFEDRETKYLKEEKMQNMYLTDAELYAMQDACKNASERLMIVMLRYTAVRSGELSKMKVSQIETIVETGGDVSGYQIALMDTKGNKPRYVFLFSELVDAIYDHAKTRKRDSDYIFIGTRGRATDKGITTMGIWKRVKSIASRVIAADQMYRFKPHSIRKSTYSNWERKSGVTEKQASLMMGHSDVRVSRENYEQHIADAIPEVFESHPIKI